MTAAYHQQADCAGRPRKGQIDEALTLLSGYDGANLYALRARVEASAWLSERNLGGAKS